MPVNKILLEVTDRIIERSKESREKYVDRMKSSVEKVQDVPIFLVEIRHMHMPQWN